MRALALRGSVFMQLDQIKAVVTGGVSGLGFAVAKHLIERGAKVTLLDINDEKGTTAVGELGGSATTSAPMSPAKTA